MRNSKGFQLQPLQTAGMMGSPLPPRSGIPGPSTKLASLGSLPNQQQFDADRVSFWSVSPRLWASHFDCLWLQLSKCGHRVSIWNSYSPFFSFSSSSIVTACVLGGGKRTVEVATERSEWNYRSFARRESGDALACGFEPKQEVAADKSTCLGSVGTERWWYFCYERLRKP